MKRELDRRRREGESNEDILKRILDEDDAGDFEDGFGRWANEEAERVRGHRETANEGRKRRTRRLAGEDA